MKTRIAIISLFFLITGCRQQTNQNDSYWEISSTNNWLIHKGLLNVESIVYDKAHQVFYATSGLNYEPGNNGFISKISKDGHLLDLKWVADLNRPTGMAIYNSVLYVADVNSLVLVNTKTGEIVNQIAEPIPNAGLNDVAVNRKGEIYVSASFVHSILKLNSDGLEVWLKDKEKLKWVNGLFVDDNRILAVGLDISLINLNSKKAAKIELNPLVRDFDGIIPDGLGGYFLTTVENSGLYHFDGQSKIYKLMEGEAYFGDIEFNPNNNKLYVPRGKKETSEFFITEMSLKSKH